MYLAFDNHCLSAMEELFVINDERAIDRHAREALLDRAMGPGRKRKSSEKLRRGRLPADGLALAAHRPDGAFVGTVRLWNVGAGDCPALLLGPLAADPAMAGRGIGAALMVEAIERAAVLGHGAILLVGDAEYYERFGFSAAKTDALAMPGPYEKHRLLALELVPGALSCAAGVIRATGRRKFRRIAANAA